VAFKEAIRLEPDYAGAHYNLGMAYNNIGNREAALEQYEILKELGPDTANKLFNFLNK
jgi:tetratricopeptide (TPR) repeat protein